jgi:hypothetical protein
MPKKSKRVNLSRTRFHIVKPMSRERRDKIVAMTTISSQTPLVELVNGKMIRIWTMYNAEVEQGTFTDVFFDGLVVTRTIYKGGHAEVKVNRWSPHERASTGRTAKASVG